MRLTQFRVEKYRSIRSTDWIDVTSITAFVGQNEAGKSNLCEALYILNPILGEKYNIDEDWPVDDWGNRNRDALVCEARFHIEDQGEIATLLASVGFLWEPPSAPETEQPAPAAQQPPGTYRKDSLPTALTLRVGKHYTNERTFKLEHDPSVGKEPQLLDRAKGEIWAGAHLPKCVYIREYDFQISRTELHELAERRKGKKSAELTVSDQTMLIVLDLARVDIDEFLTRGATPEGRTLRTFDKRQASAFLTNQFAKLWGQKEVTFHIEIDATTLNILVEDRGVGMPVRLDKRSTGFRWYVAFAWRFTHATRGDYRNTILILEEPGIHLHYDGHRDLLRVLDGLSETNTILYTTHTATMLDPGYPERLRIVEVRDHHTHVVQGVVSKQRIPMAVIETRLGLSASMSGLLGNRQTLIVEGGDDVLILQKLSGLLAKSGEQSLDDRIFLWPAQTASKTPMYAGLLIGNKFDGGVLLDSDAEGHAAKKKIDDLYLKDIAEGAKFKVLMLKEAAGLPKNEPAIEDIFPDQFYLDCVNAAYRYTIKLEDLPVDGSDQITKRIEAVLTSRFGQSALDKRKVVREMLSRFDTWRTIEDLPAGTAERAKKLIAKINAAFAP